VVKLHRGWITAVIIGDTGSGKTQTFNRFSEFVNIGDTFSGLTGSRTGLAYSFVDHKQKGWHVHIGRYPANSRKILIVDEAQRISQKDLITISKAMDEGFLQIDRVKSKGYESMTRLILICNPKDQKIMDNYQFGCETLTELFDPTIIRRMDFAVFINTNDINDLAFINRIDDQLSESIITPEMLRALIFWAWNLKPDQIRFDKNATAMCMEMTNTFERTFGNSTKIPLIHGVEFRKTLARLGAAFAVLSLSSNDDFSELIITTDHIKMAGEFLYSIYLNKNCCLNDVSDIEKSRNQIENYDAIANLFLDKREKEKHAFNHQPVFSAIIYHLRINSSIQRTDLAEIIDCTPEAISKHIKSLKRFNLIETTPNGYTKLPKFNKFLHRFLNEHQDFLENLFGDDYE
jgi:DNA-binding MarR family transcriptional regulator